VLDSATHMLEDEILTIAFLEVRRESRLNTMPPPMSLRYTKIHLDVASSCPCMYARLRIN
jgi:hypothetical protein